ncbi:MAG: Flp family type IVb pilin [Deltaproteobacteria bacterium]|jgi:Flp pilus assembly pilin Flp
MEKLSTKKSRRVRELLADTQGLSTVEYVIILCLIAVVCFAVWQRFGNMVKGKIDGSTGTLDAMPTSS